MINPRQPLLYIYYACNIYGLVALIATGKLIGDTAGNIGLDNFDIVFLSFGVLLSYYLVMRVAFNSALKYCSVESGCNSVFDTMGLFILVMQLLYVYYNYYYDINLAGSGNRNVEEVNVFFRSFWVLFPIDSIALIFYSFNRGRRFHTTNLLILILSNVMRGWSGIFLIFIFVEWCHFIRKTRASTFQISIIGLLTLMALIIAYPAIERLKAVIRIEGSSSISKIADTYFSEKRIYDDENYEIVRRLAERIQVTSIACEVYSSRELLRREYQGGAITPFWSENLVGIAYERAFNDSKIIPIGVSINKLNAFGGSTLGDTNINVSLLCWFIITPYLSVVYILYIAFLGCSCVFVIRYINRDKEGEDLIWLVWLLYLMPPWFIVTSGFILGGLVYILLARIFRRPISLIIGAGEAK